MREKFTRTVWDPTSWEQHLAEQCRAQRREGVFYITQRREGKIYQESVRFTSWGQTWPGLCFSINTAGYCRNRWSQSRRAIFLGRYWWPHVFWLEDHGFILWDHRLFGSARGAILFPACREQNKKLLPLLRPKTDGLTKKTKNRGLQTKKRDTTKSAQKIARLSLRLIGEKVRPVKKVGVTKQISGRPGAIPGGRQFPKNCVFMSFVLQDSLKQNKHLFSFG